MYPYSTVGLANSWSIGLCPYGMVCVLAMVNCKDSDTMVRGGTYPLPAGVPNMMLLRLSPVSRILLIVSMAHVVSPPPDCAGGICAFNIIICDPTSFVNRM